MRALEGALACADGSGAPLCPGNVLDFSQMQLTPAQIQTVTTRLQSANANVDDVSVLFQGQWTIDYVRDHRTTPPSVYEVYYYQPLRVYLARTPNVHGSTFLPPSMGPTQQWALLESTSRVSSAFLVELTNESAFGPIFTNSSGVIGDGFVSGTLAMSTTPAQLTADQLFMPL